MQKKKTPKKKTRASKKVRPLPKPVRKAAQKPVGKVTHFYGNIGVAIVKFKKTVSVGTRVKFKGATTDFEEEIASMQFDHKPITEAKKGKEVGLRVGKKVREGDAVYEVK